VLAVSRTVDILVIKVSDDADDDLINTNSSVTVCDK